MNLIKTYFRLVIKINHIKTKLTEKTNKTFDYLHDEFQKAYWEEYK